LDHLSNHLALIRTKGGAAAMTGTAGAGPGKTGAGAGIAATGGAGVTTSQSAKGVAVRKAFTTIAE